MEETNRNQIWVDLLRYSMIFLKISFVDRVLTATFHMDFYQTNGYFTISEYWVKKPIYIFFLRWSTNMKIDEHLWDLLLSYKFDFTMHLFHDF